jgi:TRAP-type uncharacterized transport system substrate-binding protein
MAINHYPNVYPRGMGMSTKLPLWLRSVLLLGIIILAAGAGFWGYRYFTRPVTLTMAVGSIDGEAGKAMSEMASEFASTNAPIRLQVIDSLNALDAARAFSSGKVDLAVVRGDIGDLSQAQAVVVVSHLVALIIAPPGSSIDTMDKLKGRAVGVIDGAANSKIVDVLSKEYDLVGAKTVFEDIALTNVRQAIQSKQIVALLVATPLADEYLSLVRGFFQIDRKKMPVLIPIESAAAIAQSERAFESFDVPKGTLRGSPPVPKDDVPTLRTSLYLVAQKKLSVDSVTKLTQAIMSARRNLMREQPIFAQISAPSTDQDAYLPLHPGAGAVYNATTQSFMDEYGNWIYLIPMSFGGAATLLAAAWKFLGLGDRTRKGPLDSLNALARRIRRATCEAELSDIEEAIDDILEAECTKSAAGDEDAANDVTLNAVAHRLESLIHDRRTWVARRTTIGSAA